MSWSKNIRIIVFSILVLELIARIVSNYSGANHLVEKASRLIAEKQYDLALPYLNEALEKEPNNLAALDNRANAYLFKGIYDLALKDYSTALKIDPANTIILNGRGNLYTQRRQYDLAIDDFNAGLLIQPSYTNLLVSRSLAYGAEGEFEKALNDINSALTKEPHNVTYLVARSAIYADMLKPELELQDIDKAAHLAPNNPVMFTARGAHELNNGNFEGANKDFDSAIKSDGKDSSLYLVRGEMFLYELSFERAETDLKIANELGPEKPDAVLALHIARLRLAKEDSQDFEIQTKRIPENDWPAPVINLFLGRDTVEGVIQKASDKNEYITGNQLCEAHYYIGEYYLSKREPIKAKTEFQQDIDNCRPTEIERQGALSELKALN